MIQVEQVSLVTKEYTILDNISIQVDKGTIVGLAGGNGSGKTMLMKCICGFNNAFTGKITVADKVIGKDIDFPKNTGIIIETPGFIPYYSGYKNLKVLGDLRGNISKEDIFQYMEMVELDPKLKRPVRKYSLGMRQRLGLAQALMEQPELLILDEPFNGLDKSMTEKMRKIILDEKEKGTTILLSSHNPTDMELLCDKIYHLDGGKLVA